MNRKVLLVVVLVMTAMSGGTVLCQEKALTRGGHDKVLEEMTSKLTQLFHTYQSRWDSARSISADPTLSATVWSDFLEDPALASTRSKSVITSKSLTERSGMDVGLKWTTEATHNFTTGISDNEDVFFGSRIASGLDWVILGEGSWRKRANDRNYLGKKVRRDSLMGIDAEVQYRRQQQLSALAYLFDRYRLSVFELLVPLRREQATFQAQLFEKELTDYPTKLKSKQRYEQAEAELAALRSYAARIDDGMLSTYLAIPLINLNLPAYALMVDNNQTYRQQQLLALDKELLEQQRQRDNRDNVSLRSRVRYNYYSGAGHQPRGFASVGATLSVPLRTGKNVHDQIYTYEFQRKEEQQVVEAEHRRFQLRDLYRNMSDRKQTIRRLTDELTYAQALMERELALQQQAPKQVSPNTFIELTDGYFLKLLELADHRQLACEDYIDFMYLTGYEMQVSGD
ncbi:hypothetical protein FAZ15_13915 [Sphingobacterium olei]|uniref:TolC family protein n=1 Tax=Sphingobacterium olei TaxID=2571155 RepID=A0A4U0NYT7_9SPHI|nr:hypothetical protein [Sphingobacterium olei]TJZ59979.1 hypothetical protein FAZ15_13915 [Sphingobacterium olei]